MITNTSKKRVFPRVEIAMCENFARVPSRRQVAFLHSLTALSNNIVNRLPTDLKEGKGFAFGDNHPLLFKAKELMHRKHHHHLDHHFVDPVIDALPAHEKERLTDPQKGAHLVVVDVACGDGMLLKELEKRYPSHLFIGLDNHLPFLEKAETGGHQDRKNPLFALADAHTIPSLHSITGAAAAWASACAPSESIPLPSKVDVFILTNALHDIADPLAALLSMREQLAPGGVIIVKEPTHVDPRLDSIAATTDPQPILWSAAGMCVSSPATLGGRADGVPRISQPLGPAAPDSKYFALGQSAGFSNVLKVAERLFRYEN